MCEELKQKLPKDIKWYSDGEKGNGILTDMFIKDKYITFCIKDPINGEFDFQAIRKHVGMYSYMNELHISSPLFFEIIIKY